MKTIFQSIVSVIGGEAAVRAANFAAAIYIARVYGQFVLGAYAACIAVLTICTMFADNGLQTFAITELSGAHSARERIVGQVYCFKTILLVVVILLLAPIAWSFKLSPFLWTLGAWVTARTVLQSYSQLQMAILKSLSKANAIGVIQLVHSLFLLTGMSIAYLHGWGIFALLAWFTAGQLLEFAQTILVMGLTGFRPRVPLHLDFWASMRKSTPFGITYGLANLIVRSDTIVLSTLVPLSVLGTFSAPNSILIVIYASAWLFGSVLLPEMVRLSAHAEGLRHYARKWSRLLSFSLIPCAFLTFLAAPKLMLILFGASFYRSGPVASVMVLACPFILLNSVSTNLAIAMNRKGALASAFAATAVVTIGLDFFFGHAFGPMGIAAAIVIRELCLMACFWILLSRGSLQAAQVHSSLSAEANHVAAPSVNLSNSLPAMSKIVAIDARWLVGGIGTYTENLLLGLGHATHGLKFHALARVADVARVKQSCSHVTVIEEPIYTLREQFLVPRAIRGCDLLHVPHFNVPLLYRGPLVVSIMDVIHLRSPDYRRTFGALLYARPMLNAAACKADHIVTVSNYSKAQIMETLGIQGSKISVIHCGVGPQFRRDGTRQELQAAAQTLGIDSPFLLYVGNLKPHKNVSTLLRAFAQLHHGKKLAHSLLIVGDDARWGRSIVEESSRLGVRESVVFVPYVSSELLPKIYAAAELLVMPSTVEGFGLPVLEAMACGTPVVCSNAASIPEVAGDAALYFDPASHEELAAQIENLLNSSDLRSSLRDRGVQRAKQFSWMEFTRKHMDLYYQLLGLNEERTGVREWTIRNAPLFGTPGFLEDR